MLSGIDKGSSAMHHLAVAIDSHYKKDKKSSTKIASMSQREILC